jgi:hypothetical protein
LTSQTNDSIFKYVSLQIKISQCWAAISMAYAVLSATAAVWQYLAKAKFFCIAQPNHLTKGDGHEA